MNLIEGLQKEIKRVNDLISYYQDPLLKGAGAFAVLIMKDTIKKAEQNIAGYTNVSEGLRLYSELQSYKL